MSTTKSNETSSPQSVYRQNMSKHGVFEDDFLYGVTVAQSSIDFRLGKGNKLCSVYNFVFWIFKYIIAFFIFYGVRFTYILYLSFRLSTYLCIVVISVYFEASYIINISFTEQTLKPKVPNLNTNMKRKSSINAFSTLILKRKKIVAVDNPAHACRLLKNLGKVGCNTTQSTFKIVLF